MSTPFLYRQPPEQVPTVPACHYAVPLVLFSRRRDSDTLGPANSDHILG